ncbi:hypothetical protein C8R45DRAFT_1214247 [Mycena sanguinolenta]|nr:hypothetical protein C8R45DRAFT_1214247 [Mycena sanguinolenta]
MATASPTSSPPSRPAMTSEPSTPGPELPGGYPRNSVVFSSNQWDPKGKRGLLAATRAHLPPGIASYFPTSLSSATDPASPGRPSSVGHTPGVALRPGSSRGISSFSTQAWADSDSSRGSLAPAAVDFPTPGGRTFASRLNLSTPGAQSEASEDYFGSATHSTAASSPIPGTVTQVNAVATPPVATAETEVEIDGDEPIPAPPSAGVDAVARPSVLAVSPVSPTADSDSSTPGTTSNSGSGLSTSTAPSSVIASPQSLKSRSRPSVTYSPSTADARPVVSKTGSALRNVHRRVGSLSLSSRSSGDANGRGVKRWVSLGRRGDNSNSTHTRRAASDASSEAEAARVSTTISPSSSTSASLATSPPASPSGVAPTSPSATKSSRRASIMRTLRGEVTVLAGRVRGDKERVERGKRMRAREA